MNDPTLRSFVAGLLAALALLTAPAAAQQPPASTTQTPTVPRQAVEEDENPWALAVLIVGAVCVVAGIGGGLYAARGGMRALSEGESARRVPHLVFARSAPGDAQEESSSPSAQPGIRGGKSSESVSDRRPVAPRPRRAVAGGADAGVDEQGGREGFARDEPDARTPSEGPPEPEEVASAMPMAPAAETTIETEPEAAAKLEPVPESAAAEEPERLVEEAGTIPSPLVEPELPVAQEQQAPAREAVPAPEPAHPEEQEEIAEAGPPAEPEAELEARAGEPAEPEPEVAVQGEADDASEEAPAAPAVERPAPVEEKPSEPVAASESAPRARKKKPVKARPKRAASKAKERVSPAQPKPSRRRPPREPPG